MNGLQYYCLATLLFAASVDAFAALPAAVAAARPIAVVLSAAAASETSSSDGGGNSSDGEKFPAPGKNPKYPNLPELKGDFDWDAKFGEDDDWITDNVPGKIVLDEITLAKQVAALDRLEEKWRKQREIQEYEESRNVGWTANAELVNGRFAMFFILTGLLTEYWTGFTLPGQVEEMLRIGGFIGFD